jgi:hypothetical protein
MTPLQFAEQYLSPPIRKRYLRAIIRGGILNTHRDANLPSTRMIICGFDWIATHEGSEYWSEQHNRIKGL